MTGPLPPPDVVIAGAPKTGTTAIAEQLRRHPAVMAPEAKEPRFFYRGPHAQGPLAREFNDPWIRDGQAYDALFAESGTRLRVDASTDYLSQPESADRIAARRPSAKVIIGLRHPVARAFSEHVHLLREGAETKTFSEALDLETDRRGQRWVPLFRHVERSTYAPGLRAFTERFETYVYHHEQMRSDPHGAAAQLSAFLGLDPPLEIAPVANTGGIPRVAVVNRFIRPRGRLLRAGRFIGRKTVGAARLETLRRSVDGWNLANPTRPDEATVKRLLVEFEPDIAEVEDIL